jgi:transcriptional regulator GlxA family with amidase domain
MDVALLLYEGFDELDAVAPYEVFQTAADIGADLDVSPQTLVPAETVTASHGLTIEPDDVLFGTPDLVVVPGGGWNSQGDAGAWAEVQEGTLPERLATLHDAGARIATVCTGALIAAEAGLLDGRPATTHHTARDDLADYGVDVREERVVDDGDVVTAGGVTSGIDLALHLVEDACGAEIAEQVAAEIEWESNY